MQCLRPVFAYSRCVTGLLLVIGAFLCQPEVVARIRVAEVRYGIGGGYFKVPNAHFNLGFRMDTLRAVSFLRVDHDFGIGGGWNREWILHDPLYYKQLEWVYIGPIPFPVEH
jgi:hypothetical protein